ncbi:hypothetical protein EDD18DRAFT_1098525 [Armillaria luteobubalina]|uniref:DUF6534 domain-containing protein n=1 Tax=Armillaria luteobubalina TaxID=153913 RepID=A0AA39QLF6_9AGAR|nr:hypothetical protein EDD18DRAFT_1098525 [Armillaria luteobubalina]
MDIFYLSDLPQIQILFTVLVTTPAQGFFAYRIWMFSDKSKLIISFLAPAILFQLTYIKGRSQSSQWNHFHGHEGFAIAYFIDGAVVDLFIAITMCLFLWRRTRSMIYRLTLFSINTGTWPAIIAIIALIMLMAYPTYYLYAGLYFFLSPVYCNTVLASINARPYIKNANDGRHIHMPKDSGIQFRTDVSSSLHTHRTPDELELGSY